MTLHKTYQKLLTKRTLLAARKLVGQQVVLKGNLDDESLLLQLFSRHDLQQDLQLLVALNLPHGDDGSEFGGVDSAVPGRPLAVDESLFAQLAWYF